MLASQLEHQTSTSLLKETLSCMFLQETNIRSIFGAWVFEADALFSSFFCYSVFTLLQNTLSFCFSSKNLGISRALTLKAIPPQPTKCLHITENNGQSLSKQNDNKHPISHL